MDALGMTILLGILVVLMLVGFMAAWRRDAKRSEKVADNPERLDTDSQGPHDNPADRR